MTWKEIISEELMVFMIKDGNEDEASYVNFAIYIQDRIPEAMKVIALSSVWDNLPSKKQVEMSIRLTNEINASRFMMLMDYLVLKRKRNVKKDV